MCGIAGFAGFFEPASLAGCVKRSSTAVQTEKGLRSFPNTRWRSECGGWQSSTLSPATNRSSVQETWFRWSSMAKSTIFANCVTSFSVPGHRFRHNRTPKWSSIHTWSGASAPGLGCTACLRSQSSTAEGRCPRLLLVRDRVGMKPLYYLQDEGRLVFGSEIKAILAWSGASSDVRIGAIRDYLALRYVPGPGTLFHGIQKLPAGHMATYQCSQLAFSATAVGPTERSGPKRDRSRRGRGPIRQSPAPASHLIADVPVGAFLSGGVDSNVIVSLMAEVTSEPVHTFSIGFPDFPTDELLLGQRSPRASCKPTTEVSSGKASDMIVLPDIVRSLDQPVGDPIVVPLYVLAREARRKVKVVLSGEGADEILGGYVFHRNLLQLQRLNARPFKRMASPGSRPPIGAGFAARQDFRLPGTTWHCRSTKGCDHDWPNRQRMNWSHSTAPACLCLMRSTSGKRRCRRSSDEKPAGSWPTMCLGHRVTIHWNCWSSTSSAIGCPT